MTVERIAYTPPQLDILDKLNEEADLLRDDHSRASDEELADLLGESAEEVQRLRKEIAEALYRNQEAGAEIARLRDQLGRAELSYQQCDSDRRSFAEECRVLRKERDDARMEVQRLRAVMEEEADAFNAGCAGYEAGLSDKDEPGYAKHDQWRVGWAWAKFNSECA